VLRNALVSEAAAQLTKSRKRDTRPAKTAGAAAAVHARVRSCLPNLICPMLRGVEFKEFGLRIGALSQMMTPGSGEDTHNLALRFGRGC